MPTYTAPTTRTTGELISAAIFNTDLVENIKYFKDAPGFAGNVTVAGTLGVTGATTLSSATYTTSLKSTTALATPGALTATQATAFASTVSGAAIMGFGTTNDVTLMNRAGTVVLGIGPNTTAVNMVGTLSVGAVTSSGIFTSTATGTSLFQASNAGGLVAIRINNTDTTSTSSHSRLTIDTGTGAGDPLIAFSSGAGDFALGIDNTDDTFQIVNGSALGTTVRVKIDSNGAITQPAQPAFFATGAVQSNVTGDGTLYTMVFGTEIYDQGSNFLTSTFTAPVTGRYLLTSMIGYQGVLAGHDSAYIQLVTSNRTMTILHQNIGVRIANDTTALQMHTFADMDSGDTAVIKFAVSGSTKVIDTLLDVASFSGALIC